jgi:tetratricopeptide (TPR) repeat protein
MKPKLLKACGTILFVLLVIATGRAQMNQTPPPSSTPPQSPSQGPSGQLPSGQLPATGQPAAQAAPPVDKEEEAAYKAFFDAHGADPTKQIQLGEDFVKKYPASRYLPTVYSSLALDYLGSGDTEKMVAAAQNSINLDPDNVDALSLEVWAMARRVNPQDPGAADEYVKLENYGHHAISLISTMTKPASMDDAQFTAAKNDKLSMCHSGLGLIEFKLGKPDESVAEMTQAVQLANSPDPVDYFILGHADDAVGHFDDAMTAFTKCTDPGPMQARCQAGLDDAKKKALLAPPPAAAPAPAPPKP